MTKSTITDKRVTSVIERLEHYACNLKWTNVRGAQDLLAAADGLRELQERRKADSEPVAWTWHYREQWHVTNDKCRAEFVAKDGDVAVLPLYSHAQQAVVPDDVLEALQKVARIRLDMNDFDGDRRGIADCLGDAEEALIEVVNRRAAMLAAAPHDTPALNSVQSVVTVPGKWIPVSEQKPDCWCLTCRPVTLNDMRFVVCPDCGNKRCPRANDHRNACARSNEPGQEGSAYPAAPQEVRKSNVVDTYQGADGKEHEIIYLSSSQKEVK
ncbi:hypothetical protein [Klebsiella pneumoniae]|uniref:hypothetical protein n=1 Tax=Klebsiella pneumoniae TaxID=573 RepID=UPI0034D6FC95